MLSSGEPHAPTPTDATGASVADCLHFAEEHWLEVMRLWTVCFWRILNSFLTAASGGVRYSPLQQKIGSGCSGSSNGSLPSDGIGRASDEVLAGSVIH